MLRTGLLLSVLLSTHSYANTYMPTGSEGGTYHAIGKDIANIAVIYGVDITVKNSVGSVDNIRQLLKSKDTDLSLAQSDVIKSLQNSTQATTQSAIKNLRLVMPLYQEEVHLLASKSIKTISDLSGKRVGVGRIGSGTHVTATNILSKLDIKALPNNKLSPVDAYKALLFGQLDAVFFVSGKPINYIQGMLEMNTREDLKVYAEGVHLLAIEDERLDKLYDKASIEPSDYVSKSGQHKLTDVTIPTVSVTAALVTRVFPDDKTWETKKRCRQIGRIHRAVSRQLPKLASGEVAKKKPHPKWASVDLSLPMDLEKSDCIQPQPTQKKAVTAKPANTDQIVAPSPDKVEVSLSAAEIAEANCLLETGKPCVIQEPLPLEEQPVVISPSTAADAISDLVLEPLP